MNRWLDQAGRGRQSLLIGYEDMRAEPKASLRRVFDFLGEGATDAELDAAVAFASFESLKEKERQRFFESERLQPRDDADPGSFKVRRGKVGCYRDYFDVQELALIDDLWRHASRRAWATDRRRRKASERPGDAADPGVQGRSGAAIGVGLS